MPLASPPISSTSVATSSTPIYTAATTYVRDLVVTNGGPNTFSLGTGTVTIKVGGQCFKDSQDTCTASTSGRTVKCD